jgi:hypothetical protein
MARRDFSHRDDVMRAGIVRSTMGVQVLAKLQPRHVGDHKEEDPAQNDGEVFEPHGRFRDESFPAGLRQTDVLLCIACSAQTERV